MHGGGAEGEGDASLIAWLGTAQLLTATACHTNTALSCVVAGIVCTYVTRHATVMGTR